MKQKVHTIAEESEFILIGIASHLSDYKLSWVMNEELHFKFTQSSDIEMVDSKLDNPSRFSSYKFELEDGGLYTLISNRTGNSILLKTHKNIDYILKIEGIKYQSSFLENLKKIKNILTAYEIETKSLKTKEIDLIN